MKIIIDMPEDTLCVFVNYVCGDSSGLLMGSHSIGGDDLKEAKEGKVIEVKPRDEKCY